MCCFTMNNDWVVNASLLTEMPYLLLLLEIFLFVWIYGKIKSEDYNELFLAEISGTKEERHKLDGEKMKCL